MNPIMTNEEFYQAFSNLSLNHHAPDGYWDEVNERRKKHRYVGRKAFIHGDMFGGRGGVFECVRAEDNLVIFKLDGGGELIISGNDVKDIKWIKE